MTKKQVWQYRCNFCGKKRYREHAMKIHEAGCTMNPDRVCRMHKFCEDSQKPMQEMIEAISISNHEEGFKKLRELVDGCPVCILAALRQSKSYEFDFDFKKECTEFWNMHNDVQDQHEYFLY